MRLIILQQTYQYQHGYQIGSLDLNQQQLYGAIQHTLTQQHNTMNQLNGQGMGFAPTITQDELDRKRVHGKSKSRRDEKKTAEKRDT